MAILERILEIFSQKGARIERKMEILEQRDLWGKMGS